MAIRWGICSAGKISNDFLVSLKTLTDSDHKVVAVGARSLESAQKFAKTFGIPRAYGSYEEVATDPEVDVVYVGAIHTAHFAISMMILDKGKPVLCEKPLTMNVHDTQTLIKKAQEKGLFFMEAVWMRFFPSMCEIRRLISEGAIGEVKYVNAMFAFRRPTLKNGTAEEDAKSRLVDPKVGGGAVLDIGVYVINFVSMIFGGERPESIHASGQLTKQGTDEMAAITLVYKGGRVAQLTCTTAYDIACDAIVCGTKGEIKVPAPFWCPTKFEGPDGMKEPEALPEPCAPLFFVNSTGMRYEAEEVRRCLQEKRKESLIMPHKETLLVAEIMEEAMKQIGVVYFRQ